MPATVQAVLAARIDRLPAEAKHLLQTAAVIGTEVPLPLLQAVAELDEERLHRGLAQLQAAEFLYETWRLPERAYTFKHALTQEVAYGSLVQGRRRALHARIVEALEVLAGDRLDDQVERLAQHALRGEVWDKALAYCRQAGDKAQARSAYREAVVYFEQALQYPPASARQSVRQRAGHRPPARPALGTPPARRILGRVDARPLARPSPSPRPSTTSFGWDRVYTEIYQSTFWVAGAWTAPSPTGQRALALATLGHGGLQAWRISVWGRSYHDRETIPGPSRICSGMWRRTRARAL